MTSRPDSGRPSAEELANINEMAALLGELTSSLERDLDRYRRDRLLALELFARPYRRRRGGQLVTGVLAKFVLDFVALVGVACVGAYIAWAISSMAQGGAEVSVAVAVLAGGVTTGYILSARWRLSASADRLAGSVRVASRISRALASYAEGRELAIGVKLLVETRLAGAETMVRMARRLGIDERSPYEF